MLLIIRRADFDMQASLFQFLRGEQPAYLPFKARIIATAPTRLTEDNKASVSVPDFLDKEESRLAAESPLGTIEVSVEKWTIGSIDDPNTQGCLVKLEPKKYSIKKVGPKARSKANLPDLFTDHNMQ